MRRIFVMIFANKFSKIRKIAMYSVLTVILFVCIFFIAMAVQASNEKFRIYIQIDDVISNFNVDDEYYTKRGDVLDWDYSQQSLSVVRKNVLEYKIHNPQNIKNYKFLGWSLSNQNGEINFYDWKIEIVNNINLYAIWENIEQLSV